MKKLIMGSMALLLFSASILLFQVSCQKDVNAKIGDANSLDKIVYINASESLPEFEIWTCNIDGSNQQKVNLVLPSNKKIGQEVEINADGTKLIFMLGEDLGTDSTGMQYAMDIYTCNIDGTNLTKIVGNTIDGEYYLNPKPY